MKKNNIQIWEKIWRDLLLICLFVLLSAIPAQAAGPNQEKPKEETTAPETDNGAKTNDDIKEKMGEHSTSANGDIGSLSSGDGAAGNSGIGQIDRENGGKNAQGGIVKETLQPEDSSESAGEENPGGGIPFLLILPCFAAGAAAVLLVLGAVKVLNRKKKESSTPPGFPEWQDTHSPTETSPTKIIRTEQQNSGSPISSQPLDPIAFPNISRGTIGQIYNVGRRQSQQDNYGTKITRMGLLSIVSDGMGGLSDGDKVSHQAVISMLQAADSIPVSQENPLFEMISRTSQQINQMLGPNKIYKSGATLLAVLVNGGQFHWAAVGDSRIYFYCSRHLLQLNREHIYKRQLLLDAANRRIDFATAAKDPQRDRLLSFLGMGDLKEIDGSLRPVSLQRGDKLLLMSDGVFNTISESDILRILESTENAAQAAQQMERSVLAANNPHQDNFTCIILDF